MIVVDFLMNKYKESIMKLRALLVAAALVFSANAWAQVESGVSYYQLEAGQAEVGALVAAVGYRFRANEVVSFIPEIRGGFGVKDDTFLGTDIKLNGLAGVGLRTEFAVFESVYAYGAVSYTRFRLKASGSEFGSSSSTDEEFGYGGGLGFNVGQSVSIEAGYEKFDVADIVSVGVRFRY